MDSIVITRTRGTIIGFVWFVMLALLFLLPACQGERAGEVSEEALVAGGRASFQAYCASCHGRDGKGDGPVADKLTVVPADLTKIAALRDGVFPREYVLQTIDGRAGMQVHGTRTMPVWGQIWRSDASDDNTEVEVERIVNELLHYLESIQTTGSS
jgi:mono/diheme cytochrome c family protein